MRDSACRGKVISTMGDVESLLFEALKGLIPLLGSLIMAWCRDRIQRLAVEKATCEAEAMGHESGAFNGAAKKAYALGLSNARLGILTRPAPDRLDAMVEAAVPMAARTVPPPPGPVG